MGELHDRKQADYGRGDDPFANVRASTEWGMPAWVGAMVRLTDKVRRLQTFADKGELANEGAIDSFNDIAVYAVIARVLYEQDKDWDDLQARLAANSQAFRDRDGADALLDTDSEAHREWRRQRGYIDPPVASDPGQPYDALTPEDVRKMRRILTPEEFQEWRAIRGFIDPDPADCSECGCQTDDHACEPCGLGF
jgi:hypothetical protein